MKDESEAIHAGKKAVLLELLSKQYQLNAQDAAALKAVTTEAQLKAIAGLDEKLIEVAETTLNKAQVKGPYFPLRREGEYLTRITNSDPKKQDRTNEFIHRKSFSKVINENGVTEATP